MPVLVLLYGGGDLASGVAARLCRIGCQVVIAELPQPLAVRRSVSFSSAIYDGEISVEGIRAVRVEDAGKILAALHSGAIPVLVDPELKVRSTLQPDAIIDARMVKAPPAYPHPAAPVVIGLGPGFIAGTNCHAVVETMRGHYLGRVYWQGSAQPDTGVPESVQNHQSERVLRAPADGILRNRVDIGAVVRKGDIITEVDGQAVAARFDGMLRGLLYDGVPVRTGMKIGDLDPRFDERMYRHISDKSLAVGGGVVEALLTFPEMRAKLA